MARTLLVWNNILRCNLVPCWLSINQKRCNTTTTNNKELKIYGCHWVNRTNWLETRRKFQVLLRNGHDIHRNRNSTLRSFSARRNFYHSLRRLWSLNISSPFPHGITISHMKSQLTRFHLKTFLRVAPTHKRWWLDCRLLLIMPFVRLQMDLFRDVQLNRQSFLSRYSNQTARWREKVNGDSGEAERLSH